MTRLAISLVLLVASATLVGCTAEPSQPDTMDRRQNEALRDPFSYGPTVPSAGAPARANSPGAPGSATANDPNVNKTQCDDSLKADWNRFWNP